MRGLGLRGVTKSTKVNGLEDRKMLLSPRTVSSINFPSREVRMKDNFRCLGFNHWGLNLGLVGGKDVIGLKLMWNKEFREYNYKT